MKAYSTNEVTLLSLDIGGRKQSDAHLIIWRFWQNHRWKSESELSQMATQPSALQTICVNPLILTILTTFLVFENPKIARPQTPSDKLEPDSAEAQAPTLGSADSEILLIMQEETESISRGLGQEQRISEAPSNVYVITDEDIRHSGATDLPTVLRRIPGIEVMQVTAADFDVSVRGDNQLLQNKMLILLNGRSIYEDIQGQVWWKSIPVTLPEIKRIEVLKGPASAVYGFNAFDGVINIITKSPEEMKGATAQFGGGAYGTISSAAIYANKHDKLGYRVAYGHDQTQQWSKGRALGFRDDKFNGQVDYDLPGESLFSFSGGIVDTNRFDGPVFDITHPSTKITNSYLNAFYERPNMWLRAWWQNWEHDQLLIIDPSIARFISTTGRDGSPTLSLSQNSYNLEGQHALDLLWRNRFTYGFNYRYNNGLSNALDGPAFENRFGGYIQDEWQATNTLRVTGGVRYDLDTFIKPTVSPRGALIYRPGENHTFRLAGSVAYRPPTMFEDRSIVLSRVFIPSPVPVSRPGILVGSSNLSPEKIVSYELEYQGWYFKHRLRARGSLFINHISDLIGRTRVSTIPSVISFTNNGTADIHGLEAGLEFLATSWLSGFLNYTYENIGQTFTISDIRRAAPRDKVNAGLRGEFPNGVNGEISVNYVSSASYPVSSTFSQFVPPPFNGPAPPNTVVPAYTLLNMRAGYRFWKVNGEEKAEVAVSAFNAVNDKHKENPLGDTIGSRVMGWLTIKY